MDFGKFAYFEGKIVPFEEARVSVATHAFLYGTAVFEGIRGFWSEAQGEVFVFRLPEHMDRLARNARLLRMSLPLSVAESGRLVLDLLRKNDLHCDLYIRPVLYKSDLRFGVKLFQAQELTIFVAAMAEYMEKSEGLDLCVSSWRRLEDNALPGRGKINGAYVNSCLAGDQARSNGFDEAVLLNEDGHVSEASGMNLFLVRAGRLITTPVTANILEGITRDSLIAIARREMGIKCEVRPIDRTELYVADEAFICGTAAKVVSVRSVDRRLVADGATGPLTRRLGELYAKAVRGDLPGFSEWLTPVFENVSKAAGASVQAVRRAPSQPKMRAK